MAKSASFYKTGEGVYRSSLLDRLAWVEHGFGTRARSLMDLDGVATLRQIHSAIAVDAAGRTGCLGEGDALLSDRAGAHVGVKTADCLPILLAGEERRAVAAVHAGWRGAVDRIAARTVAELEAQFACRPANLFAAIGPGIGECCFEVGPEVACRFRALFPDRADLNARARIDLVEALVRQLIEAGVKEERIEAARLCTVCSGDEFYSFRRERDSAGRMLSMIGIKGADAFR